MSWTFQSFDDDSLSKMIDAAQNRLQSLATEDGDFVSQSAKVALSDQQNGDARAVVFYDPNLTAPLAPLTGDIEWVNKNHRSREDYTDLYNKTLADLKALEPNQAFWAKISFTNRRDGEAAMILYYPQPKTTEG